MCEVHVYFSILKPFCVLIRYSSIVLLTEDILTCTILKPKKEKSKHRYKGYLWNLNICSCVLCQYIIYVYNKVSLFISVTDRSSRMFPFQFLSYSSDTSSQNVFYKATAD